MQGLGVSPKGGKEGSRTGPGGGLKSEGSDAGREKKVGGEKKLERGKKVKIWKGGKKGGAFVGQKFLFVYCKKCG